jgi:hypothetical protein
MTVNGYSDDVKRLARRYARHERIFTSYARELYSGKKRDAQEQTVLTWNCQRASAYLNRAARELALTVLLEIVSNREANTKTEAA